MVASKIEWTDRSDWNPVRGCTRVSPGCGGPGPHGGCYAEAMAARFSDEGQWGHGFAKRTAKGGRWTGLVAIQWDRIDLPLRWLRPARIFASSTSDFFHEALDMDDVAQLFGVMIAAVHLRGHTFQVLTKRADRMRAWLNDEKFWEIANAAADAHVMERVDPLDRRSADARATLDDYGPGHPPPGIWLGVSIEDQQRADERVPDLLATPVAVRFLSCEPLLGPLDLTRWIGVHHHPDNDITSGHVQAITRAARRQIGPTLDWVIAGGESGPGARPMHPDWARSLRDQCAAAGVAFHFKQWGEWTPTPEHFSGIIACEGNREPNIAWPDGTIAYGSAEDRGGPGRLLSRVGKKAAGRLLDGRTHDDFPTMKDHVR